MIVLTREETGGAGTFGRLAVGGRVLYTGEQPWLDNRSNVSCIPEGEYNVVWTYSPAFRRTMYLLLGTGPRTGIRIHPANFMGDTAKGYKTHLQGCIALGERLGWLGGQKALLVSRPAVRLLERTLKREPFKLSIINTWR